MKEQFSQEQASTINQKLQGFQHMYQQYASGLLSMNSTIIPPGHPLYTVDKIQFKHFKLKMINY